MNTHSKTSRKGFSRNSSIYDSLEKRLQAFIARGVQQENGCLIYPTIRRYPSVSHNGKNKHFGKWLLISRGIEDRNIVARHICDNTRCVNPEHIIAGTQQDNVRDLIARGTPNNILQGKGRKKKLEESQICKMQELYNTGNYTQKQVAAIFHVSPGSMFWYLSQYPSKHLNTQPTSNPF